MLALPGNPDSPREAQTWESQHRESVRIYSSLGQLELLLEKGFQRHQSNSKLEEGDILGDGSLKFERAPAKRPQQD